MQKSFEFSQRILDWWDHHGRKDLPWQKNKTRYRVWISEIMLQQTQVATVIPYYERFITEFPDVITLANAEQNDVLHLWTGLGYYARARNLHKAAQQIRDQYGGIFPHIFDQVIELSGIGRSTAAAILSLADDQPFVIMDGNVKRVLTRFHAIEGWPGAKKIENQLWDLAESHKPKNRFGDYTQAMMDLGATLCVRSRPSCDTCPIQSSCLAYVQGKQKDFPYSKPKKEKPTKYVTMLIVNYANSVLLQKRPQSGIWGGLYGFLESNFDANPLGDDSSAVESILPSQWLGIDYHTISLPSFRHTFSHFHLNIQPIVLECETPPTLQVSENEQIWCDLDSPSNVGLSAPSVKIIEQLRSQRLLRF